MRKSAHRENLIFTYCKKLVFWKTILGSRRLPVPEMLLWFQEQPEQIVQDNANKCAFLNEQVLKLVNIISQEYTNLKDGIFL